MFAPPTGTLTGSLWRKSCSSRLLYFLIGLCGSRNPDSLKSWTYQPSRAYPGTVIAPSASDFSSSYSCVRSMSVTDPRPSQRGHIPPSWLNVALTAFLPPTEIAPEDVTDGTLKE